MIQTRIYFTGPPRRNDVRDALVYPHNPPRQSTRAACATSRAAVRRADTSFDTDARQLPSARKRGGRMNTEPTADRSGGNAIWRSAPRIPTMRIHVRPVRPQCSVPVARPSSSLDCPTSGMLQAARVGRDVELRLHEGGQEEADWLGGVCLRL